MSANRHPIWTCCLRVLSYLGPITIHRFQSEYSGEMDIRWEKGVLALNSPNANYSFNKLHRVFQKALKLIKLDELPQGEFLNLGMGAGSTVSILRDELSLNQPIISVEYDQTISSVAVEYFNINRHANHEIIIDDASQFLKKNSQSFALIIADLFIDNTISAHITQQDFFTLIKQHLVQDGLAIINYMGKDEHPVKRMVLDEEYQLVNFEDNSVLIYRKTEVS